MTVPPDPSGPLPSGPALDRRLDDIARCRPFGARFHLRGRDLATAELKGAATVRWHAYDLVARRLAPAAPVKDGKQTPYRGHPVFVAQHATATCCRGCLQRWHGIPRGREPDRTPNRERERERETDPGGGSGVCEGDGEPIRFV
ncbi:DUF4186 domain-containing protein [Streptomyces sp. NPDC127079]|uniref:DUF4186 domain-containing protein n=1 Tax=Streptomyces sp. NPDC127079 TaxID=3347132 RepID=UPI003658365B